MFGNHEYHKAAVCLEELKLTLLEERRNPIDIFTKWLLRLGVAALFIFVGTGKFATHSEWVRIFERIGFGQWFRYFTGTLQILGGALVLLPKTFPVGILVARGGSRHCSLYPL